MLIERGFQYIDARRVLVYLSVEGEKREKIYFDAVSAMLSVGDQSSIRLVAQAEHGKSDPNQVIDRAKAFHHLHSYSDPNRMWLVMDADRGYLDKVEKRREEIENIGFRLGISNPCFELWLWIHAHEVDESILEASSLKTALPSVFDWRSWCRMPQPEMIHEAIRRAEALPGSASQPFPDNPGTQLGALFRHLGFAPAV